MKSWFHLENREIEVIKNMTCLQFTAPDGCGYRFYDNHIEMSFDKGVWKNIDEILQPKTEESEEKNMSKFKVGDIVRVKSMDKMWQSNMMTSDIEKFANTNHIIVDVEYFSEERTVYLLDGCHCMYFDETMLEDRTYTEDDIFNINVIVPDKVVKIEFYDGKEKMVCHKDDTFDLRKCCFIAIAKHLYKEEYTFEGIEYMAEQLMYQKKYVKIVSDALKDHRRKEAEKEKELREEEEAKIIRDRQRLKRRKKKEERAQRHREILVDLIADSINEAKVRRKDNK